jgi:probable HAF family extracellular repeat protein
MRWRCRGHVPQSLQGLERPTAEDINNAGQIVGSYDNVSGQHGFLYSSGVFTTLDDPLVTNGTEALGINDLGQIVGDYSDASGNHGGLSDLGGILMPKVRRFCASDCGSMHESGTFGR